MCTGSGTKTAVILYVGQWFTNLQGWISSLLVSEVLFIYSEHIHVRGISPSSSIKKILHLLRLCC